MTAGESELDRVPYAFHRAAPRIQEFLENALDLFSLWDSNDGALVYADVSTVAEFTDGLKLGLKSELIVGRVTFEASVGKCHFSASIDTLDLMESPQIDRVIAIIIEGHGRYVSMLRRGQANGPGGYMDD